MFKLRHCVVSILLLIMTLSCRNKKAEIVEALKVAKKHVENANTRLEAVQGIQDLQKEMVKAGMKVKDTPLDSVMKYLKLGIEEKSQWEPVVDSLEMELKKY
jgi:hypothetical protein